MPMDTGNTSGKTRRPIHPEGTSTSAPYIYTSGTPEHQNTDNYTHTSDIVDPYPNKLPAVLHHYNLYTSTTYAHSRWPHGDSHKLNDEYRSVDNKIKVPATLAIQKDLAKFAAIRLRRCLLGPVRAMASKSNEPKIPLSNVSGAFTVRKNRTRTL